MASGDIIYKDQLDKWYSKLNTFRNALGLGNVNSGVSVGNIVFASHINTLIDNIDTTYFSSYRILNFSNKPITQKVATNNLIKWLTADQINFTLDHLSVCADFANFTNFSNFSDFSNFSTCSNFSDFSNCSNFNPVFCGTCNFYETSFTNQSFNLHFGGNVGNTNFTTRFCSRF